MNNPDFYLSSAGEYAPLSQVRACYAKARLRDQVRDDYMLVGITPPLVGQRFGMGSFDISELILSTRYQGYTLFPVTEWPSHVYVARMLDDSILDTGYIENKKVELIAWGLIFPSADEAVAYAKEIRNVTR